MFLEYRFNGGLGVDPTDYSATPISPYSRDTHFGSLRIQVLAYTTLTYDGLKE
jgi:hypothetical protein